MSTHLTLATLLTIGFCILMEAAREMCFKHAAHGTSLLKVILKPLTWLGVVIWAVEIITWVIVLEHVALSIAFPLMALSYVVIVFSGHWLLKEPVNRRHKAGALLITIGVACVGLTGL